jgi:hypothetical protein
MRADRRRDHDLRRQGSAWAPCPRACGAAAGQGRGDTARELPRAGEFAISTSGGRLPIEPSTASNWAHETVAEAIPGFQLKRVRSGVETLLASQGVSRETRGHLQSHGLTGVQYRHYDGHDYLPEKRRALELLFDAIEPPKRRGQARDGAAAEQAKRRRALGRLGRDLDDEMLSR